MTDHIHRIPYGGGYVRERERIEGGNAEPDSEAALEIARAVRDRLNNAWYMNDRNGKHRARTRVDPAKDQRTRPSGEKYVREDGA